MNKEIINRYESLLNRLDDAETWCSNNLYTWDYVKANIPKTYQARQGIIKEIEYIRSQLKLPK